MPTVKKDGFIFCFPTSTHLISSCLTALAETSCTGRKGVMSGLPCLSSLSQWESFEFITSKYVLDVGSL